MYNIGDILILATKINEQKQLKGLQYLLSNPGEGNLNSSNITCPSNMQNLMASIYDVTVL